MKVEIMEKGDNEVTVKFCGETPLDAMLLATVTMGPVEEPSNLSASSGAYSKGTIIFGSFIVPVIAVMRGEEQKP